MQSAAKTARRFRRRNPSAAHPARRRLQLESLEDRSLLAGNISIADASAIEGDHTPHPRGTFVSGNFNTLTFGPDGNLYAVGAGTGNAPNSVQRFDGTTGAFIDTFATYPSSAVDARLRDLIFNTDGLLYVASIYTNEVLRFDATTGDYVDTFVTADNGGGLQSPDGLSFGPDVNGDGKPELYVTGWDSSSVVRFDGETGQPLGTFISPGSGGLRNPFDIEFHAGAAYVTSAGTNQILKYDALTGAYLGMAASTNIDYPRDVLFGPDGLMYVASGDSDRVSRFTASGTYIDDFVPPGTGGLDNPRSLAFGMDGDLYVTGQGSNPNILRYGTESEAVMTVSLSQANTSPVTADYSTADGTAAAGTDYVAVSGTVTFAPGQTTQTILVKTLDDAIQEPTETFTVNLSNPMGAAIARSQGVGTISDNDPLTKFYVVNDGSPDRTYEYAASGASVENYPISSGNTAPRGAASTAAGDKVWVVDANKNVYVYNTSGGLLGSWSAGSLPANADVQGVTTNGTDVWIVDGKGDRVYRYTGAASRLSGSQTAVSNFSLNSSNSTPKDLVTDGTSIWVVNSSGADRVFKYTVSGTLLGKWGIDPANSSPTGITIDPTNVSNIWIVDNVALKVFQYTAAAGRTSGSQTASANFVLAAGNTNPQGIADPPAPSGVNSTAAENDAALMLLLSDDLLLVPKRK